MGIQPQIGNQGLLLPPLKINCLWKSFLFFFNKKQCSSKVVLIINQKQHSLKQVNKKATRSVDKQGKQKMAQSSPELLIRKEHQGKITSQNREEKECSTCQL